MSRVLSSGAFGLFVLLLSGCASHATVQQNVDAGQEGSLVQSAGQSGGHAAHERAVANGRNAAGFARWVAAFRRQARVRGVPSSTLNSAFADAQFLPRVVELDHRQPEFTRAIWDYLDLMVSSSRVIHGREKLAEYRSVASRVQKQYGVPAPVLVAIWGMESNYGANTGHYSTVDALATLGYDGRRESFAEKQLYAVLKILSDGDVGRKAMLGSWAGAMGNAQFIPTSYLAYAVDEDGDGRRDIWHSVPDTLASIANYLSRNGWKAGQTWGREVVLPQGFDYAQVGGDVRRTTAAWRAQGVEPIDSRGLPSFSSAGIIAPAGASGPAFLVGPNFRAILRYNNAVSYALSVGLLSDRIVGKPGVQRPWPRHQGTLSRDQVVMLQRNLNRLGFDVGTPDGIIGRNTRSGVRAFQRAHGLAADGFPTRKLLATVRAAADE